MNDESILNTIKKLIGIREEDTSYDVDLTVYINSAFMSLHQLGVGPDKPYSIQSNVNTWDEFVGETENIQGVINYIYLKTKMVFDPPTGSSSSIYQEAIKELEWRLNSAIEYEDS